jgi:hypothetical protein
MFRSRDVKTLDQKCLFSLSLGLGVLGLSACATPAVMHTEAQLNEVATGCGLALGELIQDESQTKLLLAIRQEPTIAQRACVARWARRNGLKVVFVNVNYPAG